MRLSLMIGAALLAASAAVHAQAPQPEGKARRFDCSQAKDPKACEEGMSKRKAERERVRKACESKTGDERSACVRREWCAAAKDPKACEEKMAHKAHSNEGKAARDKIREACKDKKGDDYRACIREKRGEERSKK
jgi:hypothetical protein